jgi:Family of unknown function (DUF6069)
MGTTGQVATEVESEPTGRSIRAARGATVAAAAVVGVLGWVAAHMLLGIDLVVETAGGVRDVGAASVVLAAVAAGLGGWLLLVVLERTTTRPRTVWTLVALGVLLASLTGPPAAVSGEATGVLMALHLLVGGVVVAGLRRTVRVRTADSRAELR